MNHLHTIANNSHEMSSLIFCLLLSHATLTDTLKVEIVLKELDALGRFSIIFLKGDNC